MTIDGNKLVQLEPVKATDASRILSAWGRRPENFTYLTAHVLADVSDAQAYIAALFPTPASLAFHIVEPREGVVGIVKASVLGHRAQVGYVVDKDFWGRGFATSALLQLVALLDAMPNVQRIWATCALDNPASARVLEKVGFTREAVLRNWVVYPAQGQQAIDNYSYVCLPARAE